MSATLAAAAYSLTAVWYYVANPSEGYRIELYGEVGFYSALFFIVAALLWDIMRSKNTDSS
jgi:Na+/proline symporter